MLDPELPQQYDGLRDQTYVVGGAVRDVLLGDDDPSDIDLVVAGVGPATLEARGFHRVDATSFPVFHDSLGREVALPRTEHSTGAGHTDFEMSVIDPSVPPEEAITRDLERRDLTINAMAVHIDSGRLIDPFDGQQALDSGIIRHVSDAFRDDPLRVIRAARFAARFGFDIAPETRQLMTTVAPRLGTLPDDRFGTELEKALRQAVQPARFFRILDDVSALRVAYPELAALSRVPAGPSAHHQEGSALEHTLLVVDAMHDRRGNDVSALLAALSHDLGKATTDAETLPHHYGHATPGAGIAAAMRARLGLPAAYDGPMRVATQEHMRVGRIDELNAGTVIDLATSVDGSGVTVDLLADLYAADQEGRKPPGDPSNTYQQIQTRLSLALDVVRTISGGDSLEQRGYTPRDVGTELPPERVSELVHQDRVEALRDQRQTT